MNCTMFSITNNENLVALQSALKHRLAEIRSAMAEAIDNEDRGYAQYANLERYFEIVVDEICGLRLCREYREVIVMEERRSPVFAIGRIQIVQIPIETQGFIFGWAKRRGWKLDGSKNTKKK